MTTYEFTFETDLIEEHLQDKIDDQFDALVSSQGQTFFVTLEADGPNAVTAASASATALEALGIHVRRVTEDLVSRNDIAERAGKTPQAVGAWVRGDRQRQAAVAFPAPYNYVAGGVWLWSEVNEWLAQVHPEAADDVSYLAREDYAAINYMLNTRRTITTRAVADVAWTGQGYWNDAIATKHVVMAHRMSPAQGKVWGEHFRKAAVDESWDSYTLAG
ncbi:XRE family transcriptional regulator [Modestobacter muralis]|uniref:XRE family transcriptional regulator n=1 Tax=Modestobacter muralis TaxID=1608614 RepID=A0A6P0EY48_9ACTN|nr:XRE family transcriptional regulator [Modestobacter muralis]NEK96621.1 XRE family transcriptional regulator [Modestobacter muralis]NEN53540.1 XRE family transcriptional regulator [Modestobacter muralis]